VVSALVEFGPALHVLRDPGHHDAVEWADGVRAAMSPELAGQTRSWWWTTQAIRATPFVTAAPPGDDFTGRLDELRDLPARRLAGQLLRPIAPSGDRQAALHWARSRGPGVLAVVDALAARPADAVAAFVRFLEDSWHQWFAAGWARVRPELADRARQFADTAARHGEVAALTGLDPSITATPADGTVSIAKVQSARHDVSRRGLLAAASSFTRPHLYVADVPGRPLLLIYPARPGPARRSRGPGTCCAGRARWPTGAAWRSPGRSRLSRARRGRSPRSGTSIRRWSTGICACWPRPASRSRSAVAGSSSTSSARTPSRRSAPTCSPCCSAEP
jgi:hypothetical protein